MTTVIQHRVHAFEHLFIEHPGILAAENAIADLQLRLPIVSDVEAPFLCTTTDSAQTFNFDAKYAVQEEADNELTQYCVLIIGEAGSGKTRLLERIEAKPEFKPDLSGADGDFLPLIAFDMPDVGTPKALLSELFECAKLGLPGRRTRNELARQLRMQLRALGTKLIIIDEAHVLCEGRTDQAVLTAARALKFLLNTCGVPIVLLGEGPLARLEASKALKRRVDSHLNLTPYSWSYADDRFQFLDYLDQLDDGLGFKKRCGLADDMDLASRIYFVSSGHIGLVAKYLGKALKFALREKKKSVDRALLERAYDDLHPVKRTVSSDPDEIVPHLARSRNPFGVDRPTFKQMWADKFAPPAKEDKSQVVRRARKPKEPATLFST